MTLCGTWGPLRPCKRLAEVCCPAGVRREAGGKAGEHPPVLMSPGLNLGQMAYHRMVVSGDASAVSPGKGSPAREPCDLYAVHAGTRQGTEGFLGHGACQGPTAGARTRRQCALSLMGGWGGAQAAGTTTRKTGVRLRPQSGGSVPRATQPEKVVNSCVKKRYCLLTRAF
jgi:hypothetical protein